MDEPRGSGSAGPGTPARSTGTERGAARRRELLEQVADDLVAHGLVGFSLRRAARAAGTTHKVLLYHFDSAEQLLTEAVLRLRRRRIDLGLAAAGAGPVRRPLADVVRALWTVLAGADDAESRVLDAAVGLAMYDPDRHAELARHASAEYLPPLMSLCPPGWPEQRRLEVAELVLATLRGFLIDWRTSRDEAGVAAGFAALARALEREEAAG